MAQWQILNKNTRLRIAVQFDMVNDILENKPGTGGVEDYYVKHVNRIYYMDTITFLRRGDTLKNLLENNTQGSKVWVKVRRKMATIVKHFYGTYAERPPLDIPFSYKLVPGTILEKEDQKYLVASSSSFIKNKKQVILYPLIVGRIKKPFYSTMDDKEWEILCFEMHNEKVPVSVNGFKSYTAEIIRPQYTSLDDLDAYTVHSFISRKSYETFIHYIHDFLDHTFHLNWVN